MNPIPFLRRLADNNNRVWFQQHRAEFDAVRQQWMVDADRFIAACAAWEPAYSRFDARAATYRIYRDTRFSLDKTPYKTYFSLFLSPVGRNSAYSGIYLTAGLTPDNTCLYGGLWSPESPMLRKLRQAVVDNIEEFEEIINNPELKALCPEWEGRRLKTIPKGWPKDHPQAELLRLIDYGRKIQLDEAFFDDPEWPERAAAMSRVFKPLNDFINYSLFEE